MKDEKSFSERSFITRFREFAKEHGYDFDRVPDDVFSQVFRTKKWKEGILKAFQNACSPEIRTLYGIEEHIEE